jgi:hypothetical protein
MWGAAAMAQSADLLEAGNGGLRSDLRWLVDRGVISASTSTWPLPLNALQESLAARKREGLSRADEDALERVERLVRRQTGTAYGLLLQTNTGSLPQTDFEQQVRAKAGAGVYAERSSDWLAMKLQVNALHDPLTDIQDDVNLEGSYLAANVFGQVLYAGQLNHFWGPGNNGSLIWSNAATAIPGIGLRRGSDRAFETRWLSWLGPWSYEIFFGQMLNYTAVPGAKVANYRVSIRPLEGLELAGSWFEQWGGSGYRNNPVVLFNRPNSEDPNEPNNVLAGFELRYTSRFFGNPLTFYGQAVGEDERDYLPFRWFALAGFEFKHAMRDTRLQWYLEAADIMVDRPFGTGAVSQGTGTPGIAYNHSTYVGGLYHDGLPIGHYIGGDGAIVSGGLHLTPLDSKYHSRYSARMFFAKVNPNDQAINQAFPQNAKIAGGELAVSATIKRVELRAGVGVIHDRERSNTDFSGLISMNVLL